MDTKSMEHTKQDVYHYEESLIDSEEEKEQFLKL